MRKIIILGFAVILSLVADAQTTLSGKITDLNTGEALIGATIIYGKGKGTATDIDGNYSISIQEGERNLKISYVGYQTISKIVSIIGKTKILNFKLKTILLNEVQVVADIARDRETLALSIFPCCTNCSIISCL